MVNLSKMRFMSISRSLSRSSSDRIVDSRSLFKYNYDISELITWDEYHYHFLVDNNLMNKEKAKHHDEKEHDNMDEDSESSPLYLSSYNALFSLNDN